MKKNMIGTLLLSTLLLGGLATPAFAEGQATSKGDITFTEPTNTVEPLNPTDPSKPVEPADPENPATGQTGPLTLDVVPELPFGTHEIENVSSRRFKKRYTLSPSIRSSRCRCRWPSTRVERDSFGFRFCKRFTSFARR